MISLLGQKRKRKSYDDIYADMNKNVKNNNKNLYKMKRRTKQMCSYYRIRNNNISYDKVNCYIALLSESNSMIKEYLILCADFKKLKAEEYELELLYAMEIKAQFEQ